jgi:hypothetical protein
MYLNHHCVGRSRIYPTASVAVPITRHAMGHPGVSPYRSPPATIHSGRGAHSPGRTTSLFHLSSWPTTSHMTRTGSRSTGEYAVTQRTIGRAGTSQSALVCICVCHLRTPFNDEIQMSVNDPPRYAVLHPECLMFCWILQPHRVMLLPPGNYCCLARDGCAGRRPIRGYTLTRSR